MWSHRSKVGSTQPRQRNGYELILQFVISSKWKTKMYLDMWQNLTSYLVQILMVVVHTMQPMYDRICVTLNILRFGTSLGIVQWSQNLLIVHARAFSSSKSLF